MAGDGPYREAANSERCPRCDDSLELAFDGVESCSRCGGLWIARAAIRQAFGDADWPKGPSLWWRNALPCPTCGVADVRTIMTAYDVDGVMVDRCPQHGLWLDDGELARVMGGRARALDDLRVRLEGFQLERRVRRAPPPPRVPAPAAPPPAPREAGEDDAHVVATAEVERLVASVEAAEGRLRRLEAEFTAERDRLVRLEAELAAARARLAALDAGRS